MKKVNLSVKEQNEVERVLRKTGKTNINPHFFVMISSLINLRPLTLREKCPNTKFFLVCIVPHSD